MSPCRSGAGNRLASTSTSSASNRAKGSPARRPPRARRAWRRRESTQALHTHDAPGPRADPRSRRWSRRVTGDAAGCRRRRGRRGKAVPVQPLVQGVERQQPHPGRGQFERKGQAVESPADAVQRGDRCVVARVDVAPFALAMNSSRASSIESGCTGCSCSTASRRGDRLVATTVSAGSHATNEAIAAGVAHLLEVVEHDERRRIAEVVRDRRYRIGPRNQAEHRGQRRRHVAALRRRREVDEDDWIEVVERIGRQHDREPGLADTARPGEGQVRVASARTTSRSSARIA